MANDTSKELYFEMPFIYMKGRSRIIVPSTTELEAEAWLTAGCRADTRRILDNYSR